MNKNDPVAFLTAGARLMKPASILGLGGTVSLDR